MATKENLRIAALIIVLVVCVTISFFLLKPEMDSTFIAGIIYAWAVSSLFSTKSETFLSKLLLVALPLLLVARCDSVSYALLLGYMFHIGKTSIRRRLMCSLILFLTYTLAIWLYSSIGNEYLAFAALYAIIMGIDVLAAFSKTHETDWKNYSQLASMFFLLSMLAAAVKRILQANVVDGVVFLTIFPVSGIFVYIFTKLNERISLLTIENGRIRNFREKLARVIEFVSNTSKQSSLEENLSNLAATISEVTGYRYILINLLNRDEGKIVRIAHHGLETEEFERLKNTPPPVSYIFELMQERFKVSNSYFIPENAIQLPVEYVSTPLIEEYGMHNDAENWKPGDLLLVPIRNYFGDVVGYISVDSPVHNKRPSFEDIQILELIADQAYKILEHSESFQTYLVRQSYDLHTFLLTHSAFLGALEDVVNNGEQFAVALIDIDDITKINATFGHDVGDRVIERIADVIRSRTRRSDLAARYGGEEFAILLKGVSKTKAVDIISRILEEVRKIESEPRITVSAGIAVYPEHGSTAQILLKKALKALDIAKKSGKDRLMTF